MLLNLSYSLSSFHLQGSSYCGVMSTPSGWNAQLDARNCQLRSEARFLVLSEAPDDSLCSPASPPLANVFLNVPRCRSAAEAALVRDLMQVWRMTHFITTRPITAPNFPAVALAKHTDMLAKIRGCNTIKRLKEMLTAMVGSGELQQRLHEDFRGPGATPSAQNHDETVTIGAVQDSRTGARTDVEHDAAEVECLPGGGGESERGLERPRKAQETLEQEDILGNGAQRLTSTHARPLESSQPARGPSSAAPQAEPAAPGAITMCSEIKSLLSSTPGLSELEIVRFTGRFTAASEIREFQFELLRDLAAQGKGGMIVAYVKAAL